MDSFDRAIFIADEPILGPRASLFTAYPNRHFHLFFHGYGTRITHLHITNDFFGYRCPFVNGNLHDDFAVHHFLVGVADGLAPAYGRVEQSFLVLGGQSPEVFHGLVQCESDFRLVGRAVSHRLGDLLAHGLFLWGLVGRLFYIAGELPGQYLRIGAQTGEWKIEGVAIHLDGEGFSHEIYEAGSNGSAVCILPFLLFVFSDHRLWSGSAGFFGKRLSQFLTFCIQLGKG